MKIPFIQKAAAGLALLLAHYTLPAQSDLCSGAISLPVNTTCITTAYTMTSSFGSEITDPSCGTSYRDAWYTFTPAAGQTTVTITATTNRNVGIAVYTGSCGALTEYGCENSGGAGVTEVLTLTVTPGVTYYFRLFRANSNTNNMTGNVCVTAPVTSGTTTTCSDTFTDSGGSGDYPADADYTVTYCPSTAGQCISVSFSSFDTEDGYDYLEVFDGDSDLSSPLSGSPFTGSISPGTLTGTTSNATGCLTFHFTSDGTVQYSGWSATVSCASCVTSAPALVQDCQGGVTVCSDAAFSGNSSGAGNNIDIDATNEGCLFGENQSSWYYFSPSTNGTVALNITPSDPTDDYDFAIWGPMTTISCPPSTTPIRCSYAGTTGTTGLNSSAGTETTEGAGGDGFVGTMNVTAGEKYILVVDNYTSSSSPFTLDWTLSGGASLGCTVLPIALTNFKGTNEDLRNRLTWATATETNNDYFTLERSADGINYTAVTRVQGAGNSTAPHSYQAYDENPAALNYYRLKQTDFDGRSTYSNVITINGPGLENHIGIEVFPVPATEQLNVLFSDDIPENTVIYISDLTGRIVLSENLGTDAGKKHTVQLGGIKKGVYLLTAESKNLNKKSSIKKIVVE